MQLDPNVRGTVPAKLSGRTRSSRHLWFGLRCEECEEINLARVVLLTSKADSFKDSLFFSIHPRWKWKRSGSGRKELLVLVLVLVLGPIGYRFDSQMSNW